MSIRWFGNNLLPALLSAVALLALIASGVAVPLAAPLVGHDVGA